jgi:hypothetical protein
LEANFVSNGFPAVVVVVVGYFVVVFVLLLLLLLLLLWYCSAALSVGFLAVTNVIFAVLSVGLCFPHYL